MEWFKKSYAWLILNSIAFLIFLDQVRAISVQFQAFYETSVWAIALNQYWIGSDVFRTAGHWAIRFLVLSLAMSPIYYIFGWHKALDLRKSAGLWAFSFAALHSGMFFADWPKLEIEPYFQFGLAAISILAVMAITSNKWAIRLMKNSWKTLNLLVYIIAILAAAHSILSLRYWDTTSYLEMRIYGVLMIVLLALRLRWLRDLIRIPKRKVKSEIGGNSWRDRATIAPP